MKLNSTDFYHLRINNMDTGAVLDFIDTQIDADHTQAKSIFFLNSHYFNLSLKSTPYQQALSDADLVLNDGMGVKIASILQGIDLKENMNGTDLIPKILDGCQRRGVKVFLLGGKAGIAEKASEALKVKFPQLDVCGTHSGYFSEDEPIIEQINASEAELLVLGMGAPKQEIWLQENRAALQTVKIAVAGGAILDFAAGIFPRAPRFIQVIGFEWFWRMSMEPARLAKRYFFGNVAFLSHVIGRKFSIK